MDTLAFGERIFSLLDESARSSTYKPALLLALVDRVPLVAPGAPLPLTVVAERVLELYWPQTVAYATTGEVLLQNAGGQAEIVSTIVRFRAEHGVGSRALPPLLRARPEWASLLDRIELILAEYPVPRLQRPLGEFLYRFDWPWAEEGRWSVRAYRASSRCLALQPGAAEALTQLGPLLRPFIARWWTDKAAQLNPRVEAARSVIEFEDFLFGRDRVALQRIGEGLLDLQRGRCFYCGARLGTVREVDHFVPWSRCGDDGLDNLVVACNRCNNGKRATLAGPVHLEAVVERNRRWDTDLAALAVERQWPRDLPRSHDIARAAYLRGSTDRMLWSWEQGAPRLRPLRESERRIAALFDAPNVAQHPS